MESFGKIIAMNHKMLFRLFLYAIIIFLIPACAETAAPVVVILPTATTVIQPATTTPFSQTKLPTQDALIPDFEKFPNLVEVDFWYPWSGEMAKVVEKLVSDFNISNTWNVRVKASQMGDENFLAGKVISSLGKEEQPHIISAPIVLLRNLALVEEVILDLSPYVSYARWGISPQEQLLYPVAFWQQDTVGDFRFGLPAQRNAYFLFYNNTWAQELGFTSPPSTPDELLNQSCAAARSNSFDKDPENDGTGGWIFDATPATVLSWMKVFGGGQMPASESGAYLLQTSANERAFGFLQQLMRLGCAWTPLEQNPHLYLKERKALFYSGSMEDIVQQGKIDMKDEWEMIPYPSLEANEVILSDGLSYGILRSDANHDLASWLFIRWLQAPENLARIVASSLTLPPVSSVREEVIKIGKPDPAWELSLQYLPLVKSMPLLASWLNAGKVLQDAAWQVVQSNMKPGDVNTILVDAELLIKEILNR